MRKCVLMQALMLAITFSASLFLGRILFPPWSLNGMHDIILTYIRLPRLVAVVLVGAGLGLAGTSFQNVFRNYLAGPGVLGTTAGSAFGAAVAILLTQASSMTVQVSAFFFGLIATLIAYRLARIVGEDSTLSLVLAGIVVSALFSGLVGLIKYEADPYNKLPTIVYWLLGSFSGIRWCDLTPSLPPLLVGILTLLLLRWVLNILSLSDEEAKSLGVNVSLYRSITIVAATLATSASTSLAGMIAWVGVVSPHIARLLVGFDNRDLIPASALVGATLLLICDDIARSLWSAELPLSVVTDFVGAPILFAILVRRRLQYHVRD